MGATMASEVTAAQYGKQGVVRRDPMAMIPFCGYNMADYFQHWLELGPKMARTPRIFHVNWFRTDEKGKFLWPGYGENLRVLDWIIGRCRGIHDARKTPIGYMPHPEDLDLTGLKISKPTMKKLFEIDKKAWKEELKDQKAFFAKFGDDLPEAISKEHKALSRRMS